MALRFYSGSDYLKLPREPQPWIIKPLVPIGGLVNIFGKPKSRKSFVALGMALAITNGREEWNGFEVKKHGPVAYLQIDTPREEWADRVVKAQGQGFDLHNIHLADMFTVPYPYNVLEPKHLEELRLELQRIKPVMVVVDTLRESFSGDENDSNIMRDVITNIVSASRPAAVIFVSHARKDGIVARNGGSDLMDDNRGSSYVPGRMDVVLRMTENTLAFKGRASGQKQFDVEADKDGFVWIKGKVAKHLMAKQVSPMVEAIRKQLGENARLSQREIAEKLVEQGFGGGLSAERVRKLDEFRDAYKQAIEETTHELQPNPEDNPALAA